jgi:membrane protein implicated in regulation of membrane protease activity
MSEFIAAFGVLGGFITMLAGIMLAVPILLLIGMTVLAVAAIVYGVTKMRRILRRRYDDPREQLGPYRWRGPFGPFG